MLVWIYNGPSVPVGTLNNKYINSAWQIWVFFSKILPKISVLTSTSNPQYSLGSIEFLLDCFQKQTYRSQIERVYYAIRLSSQRPDASKSAWPYLSDL